jgi:hypothetical protein
MNKAVSNNDPRKNNNIPMDKVVLGEVLHAAGHLYGYVGHVPKVQDPLRLPGAWHRHSQVGLGTVTEEVFVQVTLGRALEDQAPAVDRYSVAGQ